jgi:hypothetical protein
MDSSPPPFLVTETPNNNLMIDMSRAQIPTLPFNPSRIGINSGVKLSLDCLCPGDKNKPLALIRRPGAHETNPLALLKQLRKLLLFLQLSLFFLDN